jgi:hypothetical protein
MYQSAFHHGDKIPERNNLKEERLTFVHGFRGFGPGPADAIAVVYSEAESRAPWQWACGSQRAGRAEKEHPHRHTQRCALLIEVFPDPTELTVEINHHTTLHMGEYGVCQNCTQRNPGRRLRCLFFELARFLSP